MTPQANSNAIGDEPLKPVSIKEILNEKTNFGTIKCVMFVISKDTMLWLGMKRGSLMLS